MNSYTWPRVNSVAEGEDSTHPLSTVHHPPFAQESVPDRRIFTCRNREGRVSRAGTCDIHRVGGEEIVSRIAPRCIRLLSFPWQQSALRRLDAFLLRTRGSGSKLACLPSWNFIHALSLLSFLN